ncbi:MAG: hypothetical protein H7A24_17525 [Leptospiraceae bacterium]|nr:hypothetical protein [Leptospiraceae bacterium]MCP5513694.1 hypothetical protein [Leptospiraceae bacterium]
MERFQLRTKLLVLLIAVSFINCNPFAKKEKNDNSAALAALLLSSSASYTINPTAGETICDGTGKGSPTTVTGDISSSTTWSGAVLLSGTVTVKSGATLTVSPGTTVYGQTGSSLFIVQGAKLNAIGTATLPICFTSAKSPGLRAPGDWGGVVLIGNAVGSRTAVTEGVNKLAYGSGTDDTDSSGTLKYVIVEFAGNEVSAGDELNGISSYTVGSGTTYDYVQVHRGLDDGFETWGGKLQGTHMVVTGGMDDDFDMDEGFHGSFQYLIGVKYPTACGGTASSDPHGMEMDGVHSGGNCSVSSGCSNPTVSNYVLIGQSVTNSYAERHREGMAGTFTNGISYQFTKGPVCDNSSAYPATTSAFSNVASDIALTNNSSCTGTVSATITKLPVTSLGGIDAINCGNSATKPDFNTVSDYTSFVGAVDSSVANWWSGWTVYRGK